jgi:hypothetical protein
MFHERHKSSPSLGESRGLKTEFHLRREYDFQPTRLLLQMQQKVALPGERFPACG